jgi:cobalt/nickel transport system ATP-binding protein
LVFDGVSVAYPESRDPVLSQCSFEVETGERVAILGLNGSGKTTLLLAAVGLVPSSGRILVCGRRIGTRNLIEVRKDVGFLFAIPEDQLLLPNVTDDVALGLVQRGQGRDAARRRALEVLDELGIGDLSGKAPDRLSHGQRLMTALAGVLAVGPPLLLLDEPTSRLDPPARCRLAGALSSREESLLVATHDLEFAARLCHRYILLERGKVAETGTDFGGVAERWARSNLRLG